jgi:hypothetical protein
VNPESENCVRRLEGIVHVPAAKADLALSANGEKIFSQEFPDKGIYLRVICKETMTTEIKPVALITYCSRQAADSIGFFDNRRLPAPSGELISGGQPGKARP